MPPSTPRHPAYSSYRITRNSDRNSPSNPLGRDDDPDNIDKPILAFNYKGKYLGGAYWKHNNSTLVILGDIPCVDVADMLDLGVP
jgi:hypothetical protein